jgi:transposase
VLLGSLAGLHVSVGFVASVRGRAARLLEQRFLPRVRELLRTVGVLHTDETVRHEAPCDRVEVRGLHRRAVAAAG